MAIKIKANLKTKKVPLPMGIVDSKTGDVYHEVTVAGMDGHDEELVSERKFRNNGAKIVTALLSEKVIAIGDKPYPKGIGMTIARKMWSADRDTCLVNIRSIMADDMQVQPKCPDCGEVDDDTIYMSKMDIGQWNPDNMPEDVASDELGVLMFELPDGIIVEDDETGEELICKLGRIRLTDGGMEENIAAAARDNMGVANTTLLSASIVELEHIKIVDSYVVQAMSKRDRDYLAQLITDYNPGPKFVREHVCPACGRKFKYLLRLPDFFTFGTNQ